MIFCIILRFITKTKVKICEIKRITIFNSNMLNYFFISMKLNEFFNINSTYIL